MERNRQGALLARAGAAGFDALVTNDRGIEYEQNVGILPCSVVVLMTKTNRMDELRPLVSSLLVTLEGMTGRTIVRVAGAVPE